jgi:hypothetical protein
MSYDTMPTVTAGDLVSAADWNRIGTNFDAFKTCEVIAIFDGGGGAISTGTTIDIPIDFKATIADAELYLTGGYASDASIQIDLWNDESTDFPPTSDDYITGTAKIIGSTATGAFANITISSWTAGVDAGDVLRFYVETCALISKATAKLTLNRSS